MDNKITDYIQDIISGLTNLSAEIEKQQDDTDRRISEVAYQAYRNTDILRELANTILSKLE